MSDSYIIVGGGLAGLFAARVLLYFGVKNIHIIEKASQTGGLLQTLHVPNPLKDGVSYDFDYGTHFVLNTGDPKIDSILRQDIDVDNYYEYKGSLYEGSYFNGALYQKSGCANISHLPETCQELIKVALAECVERPASKNVPSSLFAVCAEKYGSFANETIYAPAYKKFTGLPSQELDPAMGNSFIPSRLIIADRETSIALKKDPKWDERIAFADCEDGTSDIVKFYPKRGGIATWLRSMAENLKKEGVKIYTECTVQRVISEDKHIQAVELSNGEKIACDYLIWSLPPVFFGMVSGLKLLSQRPLMRSVGIVNFLTDQKPIERPYWISVYDSDIRSFRVTLYDNFAPESSQGKAYRITVEILHGGEFEGTNEDQTQIFEELKTMEIIPSEAKNLWSNATNKAEGFPVLTPELLRVTQEQILCAETSFDNVAIVGRRPDKGHGQISVIKTTYEAIKKHFDSIPST